MSWFENKWIASGRIILPKPSKLSFLITRCMCLPVGADFCAYTVCQLWFFLRKSFLQWKIERSFLELCKKDLDFYSVEVYRGDHPLFEHHHHLHLSCRSTSLLGFFRWFLTLKLSIAMFSLWLLPIFSKSGKETSPNGLSMATVMLL